MCRDRSLGFPPGGTYTKWYVTGDPPSPWSRKFPATSGILAVQSWANSTLPRFLTVTVRCGRPPDGATVTAQLANVSCPLAVPVLVVVVVLVAEPDLEPPQPAATAAKTMAAPTIAALPRAISAVCVICSELLNARTLAQRHVCAKAVLWLPPERSPEPVYLPAPDSLESDSTSAPEVYGQGSAETHGEVVSKLRSAAASRSC